MAYHLWKRPDERIKSGAPEDSGAVRHIRVVGFINPHRESIVGSVRQPVVVPDWRVELNEIEDRLLESYRRSVTIINLA
jgi:hypothetical protein